MKNMLFLDLDNTLLFEGVDKKDIYNLLSYLKKGFVLVLISNSNKKSVYTKLEFLGITKLFDEIVYRRFLFIRKPLPMVFKKVLNKYKLKEIYVVGDNSFTDILGGKLINAKTIYVGEHPIIKPNFIIKNVFELKQILKHYLK